MWTSFIGTCEIHLVDDNNRDYGDANNIVRWKHAGDCDLVD